MVISVPLTTSRSPATAVWLAQNASTSASPNTERSPSRTDSGPEQGSAGSSSPPGISQAIHSASSALPSSLGPPAGGIVPSSARIAIRSAQATTPS